MNKNVKTRIPGAHKRSRGFGIVLILGFAAILAVFTAGIGAQAAGNLHSVQQRGETDKAYYASYTGVQMTVGLLREPPPLQPDWLAYDRSLQLPLDSSSFCLAHLYHNIPSLPGAEPGGIAPDGTVIPTNQFYIISLGVVDGVYDAVAGEVVGGTQYQTNVMGATLQASYPPMPQAAFSTDTSDPDSLSINGLVDHFDSANQSPPYAPYTATPVDCPHPEASVGTDAIQAANIDIGPCALIDGFVLMGVGTPSSELEAVNSTLLPTPPSPSLVTAAPFTFEASGTNNSSNNRSDQINGGIAAQTSDRIKVNMTPDPTQAPPLSFPGGSSVSTAVPLEEGRVYLHSGNLTVTSSGSLSVEDGNLDGKFEDTIVLVEGDIVFDNTSGINAGCPPRRLKFYSLGDDTSFDMRGSEAFCLVAGENMNAVIDDTSVLWGAVLGKTVELQGRMDGSGNPVLDGSGNPIRGTIHYDVALRDPALIGSAYGYTVFSTSSVAGDAGVSVAALAQPATGTGSTTGTSGTGTSGTGTSGTGTSGTGTSGTGTSGTGTSGTGTSGTGTSGTGTSGTGTSGSTTTSGCGGCGCGCGSMLLLLKAREVAAF